MDNNQLVKATQQLAVARPESTAYAVGNAQPLVEALKSPKIGTAPDELIKQSLRYAMLLVGIKANNLPGNEEKFVMVNYLRKHFGGNTVEEIRLAFEKAIAGDLPLPDREVKAYENFSCAYVGSILRAYRQWAKTEIKEGGVTFNPAGYERVTGNELPPIPQEESDRQTYDFWKNDILNDGNVDFVPSYLFDVIERLDGKKCTPAGIEKALCKAQGHILARLGTEKAWITEEKHPARYWEIVRMIEVLNGPVEKWQVLPEVQKLAKAFWCKAYFLHTNLQLNATTTNSGDNQ